MNPIDKMLLDHANKIEIRTFHSPNIFEVVFSSFPSDDVLLPLVELIKTDRFRWSNSTVIRIDNQGLNGLLYFIIEAVNLIPSSDAIAAIAQMWRDAGYSVAIVGQAQANDVPKQAIVERK